MNDFEYFETDHICRHGPVRHAVLISHPALTKISKLEGGVDTFLQSMKQMVRRCVHHTHCEYIGDWHFCLFHGATVVQPRESRC